MKRVFEIDLIKVLALILMPMSHIYEEFGVNYNLMKNIPNNVNEQLGLLFMNGPTLFMICLGFGIIFSKNSTPKKLMIRGLSLFVIEAILNIFRFILPYSVVSFFTKNVAYFKESLELFVLSDILPFAGFAFIFFALVKKWKIPNFLVLSIGLLFTVIQNFLPHPIIHNVYSRYLTGYFIYVDESSFFPIISWLIYPIIGYLLGQKYLENIDKNIYYLIVGFLSLFIFIVTNVCLFITNSMDTRYYLFMENGFQMDLFTTLIVAPTSVMILCIAYLIGKIITSLKFKDFIASISKNINSIYCIHWVIVKTLWAFAIILVFKLEYNYIFIIGFGIFVLSSILAYTRNCLKNYFIKQINYFKHLGKDVKKT